MPLATAASSLLSTNPVLKVRTSITQGCAGALSGHDLRSLDGHATDGCAAQYEDSRTRSRRSRIPLRGRSRIHVRLGTHPPPTRFDTLFWDLLSLWRMSQNAFFLSPFITGVHVTSKLACRLFLHPQICLAPGLHSMLHSLKARSLATGSRHPSVSNFTLLR